MSNLNFRPATGADELFAIAQDAYGGSPWTSAAFERDLNSRLTHYLVLTRDDEPIGFVGGTLVIDELSVSNVAIKTAFQKQGLGQKLLLEWFTRFDPKTRVLLEVRASNGAAKHVYEKLGFNVYHERKDYYQNPREDAFLMDYYI
ncbi:ribosomal-protein-alanine N-acetyltransferase [Weissella viridescens]|uniref:[Ribosomal protein bS18]-alanine N-acetyltransferase n=1 Tax=Weissella viridescens TaxID=1629 RepID=A0A3P2RGV5_WEIVI|nr:ribosomal protein S18-alanine N-acetyltransferase [Weissella viridescens]RRG18591.1 ribosomal-protein-alanine N-acetyltransferase [Weissella viridescens]